MASNLIQFGYMFCCWYRTRLIPKVSLGLGFKPKTVDEENLKKEIDQRYFCLDGIQTHSPKCCKA